MCEIWCNGFGILLLAIGDQGHSFCKTFILEFVMYIAHISATALQRESVNGCHLHPPPLHSIWFRSGGPGLRSRVGGLPPRNVYVWGGGGPTCVFLRLLAVCFFTCFFTLFLGLTFSGKVLPGGPSWSPNGGKMHSHISLFLFYGNLDFVQQYTVFA